MSRTVGRLGLLLSLLLITLLFVWSLWFVMRHWRPAVGEYRFQGIDVSARDGTVDWPAMKAAGAAFGYARATDGAGGRDARFEENWRAIQTAGMRRGAVHVWSLCRPATDQANDFITTVPRDDRALPPALALDFVTGCDAEPERDALIGDLRRFIATIEAHSGRPVVLQVSRRFEALYRVTEAIDRPVWSTGNFFPPAYAARPWRMWRATDMRRVDGVAGPVNWDVVAQ